LVGSFQKLLLDIIVLCFCLFKLGIVTYCTSKVIKYKL
jgi:hypothetical protein